METTYANVMNLALEVQEVGPDRSRRMELEEQYDLAIRDLVDSLLLKHGSAKPATRVVEHDFTDMLSASNGEFVSVYDRVRYDIVRRIDHVAGPTPAQQVARTRLVGIGATLLVILLAVGYAALRQFSATPVTAAIETRQGIEQRTDALAKVLRYDSFGSRGRGIFGLIKNVVLWPIEPTETEAQSAGEFAGAILGVARELRDAKAACNLPFSVDGSLGQGEMTVLEDVVSQVRDPETTWRNPPVATIVDAIRAKFPC